MNRIGFGRTVTLTIIGGETDAKGGVPLDLLSGVLPSVETPELMDWMESLGVDPANPDMWVLIEPTDGARGRSTGQVDTREVEVTDGEMAILRNEIAEQHELRNPS